MTPNLAPLTDERLAAIRERLSRTGRTKIEDAQVAEWSARFGGAD